MYLIDYDTTMTLFEYDSLVNKFNVCLSNIHLLRRHQIHTISSNAYFV